MCRSFRSFSWKHRKLTINSRQGFTVKVFQKEQKCSAELDSLWILKQDFNATPHSVPTFQCSKNEGHKLTVYI